MKHKEYKLINFFVIIFYQMIIQYHYLYIYFKQVMFTGIFLWISGKHNTTKKMKNNTNIKKTKN